MAFEQRTQRHDSGPGGANGGDRTRNGLGRMARRGGCGVIGAVNHDTRRPSFPTRPEPAGARAIRERPYQSAPDERFHRAILTPVKLMKTPSPAFPADDRRSDHIFSRAQTKVDGA